MFLIVMFNFNFIKKLFSAAKETVDEFLNEP